MAMKIAVDKILVNPKQPRRVFDLAALEELAQSIRENGVIQPVTVERLEEGEMFVLVDGERRLRAAKLAGLEAIPVYVQESLCLDNLERLLRALVANVQREDLSPIEEALVYDEMHRAGWSMAEIARRTGKSQGQVESRLSLLKLEQPVQDLVEKGKLPRDERLTKALLEIPDARARVKLATKLAEHGSSIRAGVAAAQKVREALEEAAIPAEARANGMALALAARKTKAERLPPSGWDMLKQVGQAPGWEKVEQAARETCGRCVLRDAASEETCGDCPAVELLRGMMEGAK